MNKITFKQFKLNLIAQPYFVWHTLDVQEDDFDPENFWSTDFEVVETPESQVIAQTFNKIAEKATQLLIAKGAVVISGSNEVKIEKTKEYFGTDKLVLNPVFEYNGAYASPLAFDFATNTFYDVKFSKKTKRIDFMKAYYNLSIIEKNNIEIKDFQLFVPYDGKGKKGVIELTTTNRIHLSKTGDVYDAYDKNGDLKAPKFLDALSTQDKFILKDIDIYLNEIKSAESAEQISENLFDDATEFGDNPYWNELLEKINNPYAGVSGNIISKKEIIENEIKSNNVWETYKTLNGSEIIDREAINKLLTKIASSSRIIWYDFEGYSLPFPAIDDTKPYQQMVFQLSKIETNADVKQLSNDNLVWDPKTLNANALFEVMVNVYSNGADKYVVYNQGYENTRLKEIRDLLFGTDKYDEASMMYEHISNNTIDLWDIFRITKGGSNVPPVMLNDQKCKSSIKNIEKHISKNKIEVGYKIQEYKNLDVQNGGQAMSYAIKRATGVMGDAEWAKNVEGLKAYCENDVKMMIMVYHFIKWLQK